MVVMAAASLFLLSGCNGNGTVSEASRTESGEIGSGEIGSEDGATEKSGGTEATDSEQEAGSEGTQSKQEFTDLDIDISEGDLYIRTGDAFSLTRNGGKDVDYTISDGTLYFQKGHTEDVLLTLPENADYGNLKLTVENGHAYVEGSLIITNLDLEIGRGEASLEQITVLNDSRIEIGDGTVSMHGDPGVSVAASCRQGHLNLFVPFEEMDCNYKVEVSGGNIRVGSHSYHGKNDSHTVDNGGTHSMELSCTHGDMSVEFGR